jgi:hypothetical protein
MASTAVDVEGNRNPGSLNGTHRAASEKKGIPGPDSPDYVSVHSIRGDNTHRTLKSRHIQLIGKVQKPKSI